MARPFKKGDILLCIQSDIYEDITKGKHYKITRILGNEWWFVNDIGLHDWWCLRSDDTKNHFKKVQGGLQIKFKQYLEGV